jgi:type VI secretion system protein ImpF
MAKLKPDQPLVPSVLDRLLDDDPAATREAARGRSQLLRDLKQSVRRDLENLLNTRRRGLSPPPGLSELEKSLVNYGLPDFVGARLSSADSREAFCRAIEEVIRTYEPRFKTVHVVPLTGDQPLDRTLRFRIDALLHADPAPEPVVFDSALDPGTNTIAVKGVGL